MRTQPRVLGLTWPGKIAEAALLIRSRWHGLFPLSSLCGEELLDFRESGEAEAFSVLCFCAVSSSQACFVCPPWRARRLLNNYGCLREI